jgi:hypothetical protein
VANSITLLDGKYTFVINDQLQVEILRYGEPWRQFEVGDKAMWTLVTHAIELEAENWKLKEALRRCHVLHTRPMMCANLVDEYFHEFFPKEYNPHKKTRGAP